MYDPLIVNTVPVNVNPLPAVYVVFVSVLVSVAEITLPALIDTLVPAVVFVSVLVSVAEITLPALIDTLVPAVYVVSALVSVLVIVKLGYVPEIAVAPAPVNATVWSGAVFENTVPANVNPEPAVYVVFVFVLT